MPARRNPAVDIKGPTTWARAAAGALRPALVAAAFYVAVALILLATHAWDPRFFATVGPEWQRHDPGLSKQADGIIFFDFAISPVDAAARWPRFRTARILYPVAAHVLALGHPAAIGWSLVLINIAAIALGTEILHRLLVRRGLSPWAALGYGGWCGLGLALLHGTAEPLAYLCALAGAAALDRRRLILAGATFLGALLTRETTILVVAPFLVLGRDPARRAARWAFPLVVLGVWGAWLGVVTLVSPNGSGPWTDMWRLPLSGFLATRLLDLPATILFVVGPALLVLAWAAGALRRNPGDAVAWAAILNALLVLWLPPASAEILWHSARLATGLVPTALLLARHPGTTPPFWWGLAGLFAASSGWTVAVTARYVLWDTPFW